MKVVISSDCHWHLFKDFDRILSDGSSSRLSLFVKSFDYLTDYCKTNNISHWIHAGDFFNSRESISAPVLHALGEVMSRSADAGIKHYFLKGNHDIWNKSGTVSSIPILSGYGKVYLTPLTEMIGDLKVNFIPWSEGNLMQTISDMPVCDLAITHATFFGAKLYSESEIFLDTGIDVKYLNFSKFKYLFSGHIHLHQKLHEQVYYVGSLMSHSFKDKNAKKGFIVYDSAGSFEFVENPHSPKFIQKVFNSLEEYKEYAKTFKCEYNEFYDLRLMVKDNVSYSSLKDSLPETNTKISIVKDFDSSVSRLSKEDPTNPEFLIEKYSKDKGLTERLKNVALEYVKSVK